MYKSFDSESTVVTVSPIDYGHRLRFSSLPDVALEGVVSHLAILLQQPRGSIASLSGPLRAINLTVAALESALAGSTALDADVVISTVLSMGISFGAIADAFDSWQRLDKMRMNRGVVSQDAAAAAFAALSSQGHAVIKAADILDLLTYVGATQAPRGNQKATVDVVTRVMQMMARAGNIEGDAVQVTIARLILMHLGEFTHWAASQHTPAINPGVGAAPAEVAGKTMSDLKKLSSWIAGTVVTAAVTVSSHLNRWLSEAPVKRALVDQALLSATQYHELVASRLPSVAPYSSAATFQEPGLYDISLTGTGFLASLIADAGSALQPTGAADILHPLGADEKAPMMMSVDMAAVAVAKLATSMSIAMQAATAREENGDASAPAIPGIAPVWPHNDPALIQGVESSSGYPILVTTDPRIRVPQGATSALRLIKRRSDRILRAQLVGLDEEVPLIVTGRREAAVMMHVPPLMPVIGKIQDQHRSYAPAIASLANLWSIPTVGLTELWEYVVSAGSFEDASLKALAEVFRFIGILVWHEGKATKTPITPRSGHWYHASVVGGSCLGAEEKLFTNGKAGDEYRALTFRPFTAVPDSARLTKMATSISLYAGGTRALNALPMYRWISSITADVSTCVITGWRVAQDDELDLVLLPSVSEKGRVIEVGYSAQASVIRPRPFNCELTVGAVFPSPAVASIAPGGAFDIL